MTKALGRGISVAGGKRMRMACPLTRSLSPDGGEGETELGRRSQQRGMPPHPGPMASQPATSLPKGRPPHPNPSPPMGARVKLNWDGAHSSVACPLTLAQWLPNPPRVCPRAGPLTPIPMASQARHESVAQKRRSLRELWSPRVRVNCAEWARDGGINNQPFDRLRASSRVCLCFSG